MQRRLESRPEAHGTWRQQHVGEKGWVASVRNFRGQIVSHEGGYEYTATVAVDGDWIRIWNEHKRVGAWPVADVQCERVTVFRFQLTLDDVVHTFQPEDPAGFAESVGAIIDLRPTHRFGLGPRVKAAKEELAAARAARAAESGDQTS